MPRRRKPDPPSRGPSRPASLFWVVALTTVLLSCAVRFRLLDLPLERDEGEYAYAGQLVLEGVPPYREAYNMKFPGIYGAYALILAIFGPTPAAIHLGVLLVSLVATFFVFLLGRGLFDTGAGLVACAAYALLSTSPSVLGLAGHATHFVVLPALGGLILLRAALPSGRSLLLFAAGVLFGVAILMKQPGAFFALFAVVWLAWQRLRDGRVRWPALFRDETLLAAGILLPFGLTCGILYWAGVFDRFWFWTFTYARQYVSQVPLATAGAYLVAGLRGAAGPFAGVWLLAPAGLAIVWQRQWRASAAFPTGLLVFSFLAVCPGFYFREHYFILVLPVVALLAGVAVVGATDLLSERVSPRLRYVPLLVFVAAVLPGVVRQRQILFELSPPQVSRAIYGGNPFPESLEIARYIREHSDPNTRIAILGSEPQIYFYANRRSATGYIYAYGLMEEHPYAREMQEEMIREIEASRPEYLVFVGVRTSWLARPRSEKLIWNWLQQYTRAGFDTVGVVDILSEGRTEVRWDDQAQGYKPRSNAYVTVFRRRK